MIDISKALKTIERETPKLGHCTVALADAVGRILAEEIVADSDLPPFDRSQMDGYAVASSDTANAPATLKVIGESAAGRGWHQKLRLGEAVRIMTGARVPEGADAVQRVELTSGWDGDIVTIHEAVKAGASVVRKGAEIRKGRVIFRPGDPITAGMVSPIASFGYARVRVGKVPTISLMATGSEIVPVAKKPGRDQIRNSNSVMLDVLCRGLGCTPVVLPTPKDDLLELKQLISTCRSQILVITGGVSVGKYDLTKTALQELGAEIFFEKVRLKPGKPAVFARLGKKLVFGLPGNPVSAAVTFALFVRKAILHMQGAANTDLRSGNAVLSAMAKAPRERDAYIPSALSADHEGRLLATPLKSQGSSDFIGAARADSLVTLRRGSVAAAGQVVRILYL